LKLTYVHTKGWFLIALDRNTTRELALTIREDSYPLFFLKLLYTSFNLNTFTMETTTLKLTWEEYKVLLSAIQAMKNMVDSTALESLYVKLYMQMNAQKELPF
tara:strand:- start:508 stop:816 length:309 start_codon:yes stop_codon:yes gene_type:complete